MFYLIQFFQYSKRNNLMIVNLYFYDTNNLITVIYLFLTFKNKQHQTNF